MCSFHDRLELMVTSMYLLWWTRERDWFNTLYSRGRDWFVLVGYWHGEWAINEFYRLCVFLCFLALRSASLDDDRDLLWCLFFSSFPILMITSVNVDLRKFVVGYSSGSEWLAGARTRLAVLHNLSSTETRSVFRLRSCTYGTYLLMFFQWADCTSAVSSATEDAFIYLIFAIYQFISDQQQQGCFATGYLNSLRLNVQRQWGEKYVAVHSSHFLNYSMAVFVPSWSSGNCHINYMCGPIFVETCHSEIIMITLNRTRGGVIQNGHESWFL